MLQLTRHVAASPVMPRYRSCHATLGACTHCGEPQGTGAARGDGDRVKVHRHEATFSVGVGEADWDNGRTPSRRAVPRGCWHVAAVRPRCTRVAPTQEPIGCGVPLPMEKTHTSPMRAGGGAVARDSSEASIHRWAWFDGGGTDLTSVWALVYDRRRE